MTLSQSLQDDDPHQSSLPTPTLHQKYLHQSNDQEQRVGPMPGPQS